MKGVLLRTCELLDGSRADVRIAGDRITAVAVDLSPAAGETVIDAAGRALLPGLHDHHIHLLSLAAALASVRCGPPEVRTREELTTALQRAAKAAPHQWLRGVGYHESVAGPLDRAAL